MTAPGSDSLATRASLLARIKETDDQASWQEFDNIYRRLIRNFALKLGVPEADVPDVVQDTLTSVARSIRDFQYDPKRSSFKTWLLKVARNRIADYFRRLPPGGKTPPRPPATNVRTSTVERIPDPASLDLDAVWDGEWRNMAMELALEKLKAQASTAHFQIFYLHVIKQQPAGKVAKALGVSIGQVYLVKHRLKGAFEKAVRKLEEELDK